MRFPHPFNLTILLFLFNTGEGSALLMHGNANASDTIHGSGGHNIDASEIKQMFLNLTAEVETLKRKTENDGSTIQVLRQNLTILGEEKKMLQNRVFFLEAELNKLNASKPPSSDELMAYLRSTKQIVQTLAANEEYDKNQTQRLNDATKKLEDLEIQMRYTSLSLLDIHSMAEELNGSLVKLFEDKINDACGQFTNLSRRVVFTAGVTTTSSSWNSGTLVYDKVINNVGGGYNPTNGIFTAPVDGDYVFYVTILSYSYNEIYVDIVLNGSSKVRAIAYTHGSTESDDTATNMVTLRLQQGDTVWVKHNYGTGYASDSNAPITTFSGFLI